MFYKEPESTGKLGLILVAGLGALNSSRMDGRAQTLILTKKSIPLSSSTLPIHKSSVYNSTRPSSPNYSPPRSHNPLPLLHPSARLPAPFLQVPDPLNHLSRERTIPQPFSLRILSQNIQHAFSNTPIPTLHPRHPQTHYESVIKAKLPSFTLKLQHLLRQSRNLSNIWCVQIIHHLIIRTLNRARDNIFSTHLHL
ncbi:hypothetical protein BDZ45DRAFT_374697 [Acephala macrosclerotiorum]|nr:hypothetical protein BDZ45DRAFT_374697 [Acephala macrosclerotiorum]